MFDFNFLKGDKARGDKAMGENRNCLLYMTPQTCILPFLPD
jgi:hypothetical protein